MLQHGVSPGTEINLLDIRMPGRSALELLRKLDGSGNRVPVIRLTAHGDVAMVEAMKLGAADFHEKLYPMKRLTEVINRTSFVTRANGPSATEEPDALSRVQRLTERQRQVRCHMAVGEPKK